MIISELLSFWNLKMQLGICLLTIFGMVFNGFDIRKLKDNEIGTYKVSYTKLVIGSIRVKHKNWVFSWLAHQKFSILTNFNWD